MTKTSIEMTRRGCLVAAGAALLLGVAFTPASAQEKFPSKTIDVVTHAGAGGGTDATVRVALIKAREVFDVDMRVVNRQGGGGAVAMNYIKEQPHDGHTIMLITPSHLMTMAQGKAPFGIDQMVGLARATDEPQFIMAKKGKFKGGIKEAIEEGKKRNLKVGGTHVAGIDQVAMATFAKRGGFKINYVPYQGGGHILTSLIGGDIELGILNISEAESQITAGEVEAVVILAEKRSQAYPNVPSTGELGIEAYFSTIRGFVTMADVPADRLKKLEEGLLKAMKDSLYMGYLKQIGLDGSSISDAAAWDKQIKSMYKDSVESLTELGFIKK